MTGAQRGILWRLLLAAVLGLVTTVALAWWIIWPWHAGMLAMGKRFDDFVIGPSDRFYFVQTASQRGYRSIAIFAVWRAPRGYPLAPPAITPERIIADNRAGTPSEVPSFAKFPESADEVSAWTGAAGWPMLCLAATDYEVLNVHGRRPVVVHRYRALLTPELLPRWSPWHPLPLRPIWPGLILDSGCFTLLWSLLIAGPGAARRMARVRRGHCLHCNYDLRGLPNDSPCPECGEAPS